MEKPIEKFEKKDVTIGVVGLGYVGLPLMLRFADVGIKSIGFDISEERVALLNKGHSYIQHISKESISKHVGTLFNATTDFQKIKDVDAIIICVPTPLTKNREPELSYILATLESMQAYLKPGQVISLESTTYPGTTDEVLKPRFEELGFTIGKDLYLVYSPEREDPGNEKYTTATIPKIVGGTTKSCLEVGKALYGTIIEKIVPVSSTRTAEMTKLLENIHRSVNIGLVNEMKLVAQNMGIDIYEVIDAAATKPFGFVPYYPGPGIGGHCIPIDPFYLTWKAREYGLHTRFIELAGEINTRMPNWTVERISEALNNQGKSINSSNILILGLAYKKDIDDTRESPSIAIFDLLTKKGGNVSYSDSNVPEYRRRTCNTVSESVTLSPDTIKSYDCVILATDHTDVDYQMIHDNANLIVDTRGVYSADSAKVVRA